MLKKINVVLAVLLTTVALSLPSQVSAQVAAPDPAVFQSGVTAAGTYMTSTIGTYGPQMMLIALGVAGFFFIASKVVGVVRKGKI